MENILHGYEGILEFIANFAVISLELIGIFVIIIGTFKSIINNFSKLIRKKNHNSIKMDLAQSLALGLEFKMGAEIIKTVLVRDLNELIILAFIIVLRAGLTFLIHWEIKLEREEVKEKVKDHEKKSIIVVRKEK